MKTALRVIIYIVVVPVAVILLPIFIVESDFWADCMSGKYDHLLEWICPIAFLTFFFIGAPFAFIKFVGFDESSRRSSSDSGCGSSCGSSCGGCGGCGGGG